MTPAEIANELVREEDEPAGNRVFVSLRTGADWLALGSFGKTNGRFIAGIIRAAIQHGIETFCDRLEFRPQGAGLVEDGACKPAAGVTAVQVAQPSLATLPASVLVSVPGGHLELRVAGCSAPVPLTNVAWEDDETLPAAEPETAALCTPDGEADARWFAGQLAAQDALDAHLRRLAAQFSELVAEKAAAGRDPPVAAHPFAPEAERTKLE